MPLPGVATADGDALLRRIFFNGREKATRDGNHFPGKFPGGRKRRESFLNHPFAAVALGRPSRSKLIESSVMRFRPLLSRNFNRRDGGREERKGHEVAPATDARNVCRELFNYFTAVPRPAVPLDLLVAPTDQPRTELTVSRTYGIRSNRGRDNFLRQKKGIKKI